MLCNEAAVLLQLREDVTRYRYGDEQHLDGNVDGQAGQDSDFLWAWCTGRRPED